MRKGKCISATGEQWNRGQTKENGSGFVFWQMGYVIYSWLNQNQMCGEEGQCTYLIILEDEMETEVAHLCWYGKEFSYSLPWCKSEQQKQANVKPSQM